MVVIDNAPNVTPYLFDHPIDFSFLVGQATVQVSVENGSVFYAIQYSGQPGVADQPRRRKNYSAIETFKVGPVLVPAR
jgi:hypothetical protein